MMQENENGMKTMAQGWADMAAQMTRMNNDTLMAGVRGLQPWIEAYSRLFTAAMPGAQGGCQIPETACPPYCACTLAWTVMPGDLRVGNIEIKNTSKEVISYSVAATPFSSCGRMTKIKPQLEPESGRAAPGESMHVRVSVTADRSWRPGETYESEIKVRGKYERCVCLRVEMASQPEACCRVELGEIPQRVHADDWRKHFQCTELCFEPIDVRGNPTPNDPNNPR